MRTGRREIVWGEQFSELFSRAKGQFIDVKKYAVLNDTIGLMKEVISKTLDDTKRIAAKLKGATPRETCRKVWNFCFDHIQYEKDAEGVEQVRRPARAWQDRISGVDCDCLTVFICSCLTNLQIPFLIRITKYNYRNDFEHVYPVALVGNESIIMDCVVHQWNYEVPYTEKKDITMKLQYLNGFDDDDELDDDDDLFFGPDLPEDAEALLLLDDDLEGLDGKAERKERQAARKEKREDKKEVRQEKKEERKEKREEKKENRPPLKERVKNVVNKVNKINPVTALLRAGILASMKLNVGKVAGKLRYSYWTKAQATANNMEPAKYDQLLAVRQKLEKIFFGAGGKIENLKKSVLEGKGNKDRKVPLNGLGAVIQPVSDYDDLQTIIGDGTYYDEFDEVRGGAVHGLGEVISATAAVTAASGVIATIMGLIKKIGSLFKKGTPQEQQEVLNDNTADAEEKTRVHSVKNIAEATQKIPKLPQEIATKYQPLIDQGADILKEEAAATTSPEDSSADADDDPTELDLSELQADDDPSLLPETSPAADKEESGPGTMLPAVAKTGGTEAAAKDAGTPKADQKTGIIQWAKDHKLAATGIVLATAGLAYLAYNAYQKSKAAKAGKPALNGAPGKKKRKAPGIKRVRLQ